VGCGVWRRPGRRRVGLTRRLPSGGLAAAAAAAAPVAPGGDPRAPDASRGRVRGAHHQRKHDGCRPPQPSALGGGGAGAVAAATPAERRRRRGERTSRTTAASDTHSRGRPKRLVYGPSRSNCMMRTWIIGKNRGDCLDDTDTRGCVGRGKRLTKCAPEHRRDMRHRQCRTRQSSELNWKELGPGTLLYRATSLPIPPICPRLNSHTPVLYSIIASTHLPRQVQPRNVQSVPNFIRTARNEIRANHI